MRLFLVFSFPSFIGLYYSIPYIQFLLNNNLNQTKKTKKIEVGRDESYKSKNHCFSILDRLDYSEIQKEERKRFMFSSCLTNKLFISSNLYGHELIRYYDF